MPEKNEFLHLQMQKQQHRIKIPPNSQQINLKPKNSHCIALLNYLIKTWNNEISLKRETSRFSNLNFFMCKIYQKHKNITQNETKLQWSRNAEHHCSNKELKRRNQLREREKAFILIRTWNLAISDSTRFWAVRTGTLQCSTQLFISSCLLLRSKQSCAHLKYAF